MSHTTIRSIDSFVRLMKAQLSRRIENRFRDEARELMEKILAEEFANFSVDAVELVQSSLGDSQTISVSYTLTDQKEKVTAARA